MLWGCPYTEGQVVYESTTAGTEVFKLGATGIYKIECVGGSGAAAMRGVYDDRGYGWTGGSGGAFVGTMVMTKGKYDITVGKANTNTKDQGGNSNTMNPDDLTLYPSIISGILECGGGGSGHYNSSYVGAAGAAPIFYKDPLTIELNTAGNAGAYGSGGKGSGANWTHQGGASVYEGYGKGQGCSTSEYASRRYWIAGTGGIVRITYLRRRKIFNFTVNPDPANAEVIINNIVTNTTAVSEDSIANYTVSLDGYATKSGSVRVLEDTNVDVKLDKLMTFTVKPNPGSAIVTINGEVTNSVTLIEGSEINWSVSLEGYAEQSGTFTLTEDTLLDIQLKRYAIDEVVFESNTAGAYDVELLEDGTYEIFVVGAGGGGSRGQTSNSAVNAGGGSGGYSNALMTLSAGNYSAVVGTGGAAALFGYPGGGTAGHGSDSSFDTLVAGGGKGGHSGSGAYGGAGGTGTTLNGNTGQAGGGRGVIAGGDSVYGGYGAGGAAQYSVGQWPGGAGYVKIVYKG